MHLRRFYRFFGPEPASWKRALACRPQVDPREEHGQLRGLEFDAILGARLGHLVASCLQAFVPDGQPIAVKIEDLDPVPAAVEKKEEMAGQGVLPKAPLNEPAEAIKALAQVGGPRAEKDSDGRGEHDHGVAPLGGRPASGPRCGIAIRAQARCRGGPGLGVVIQSRLHG